MPQERLPKQALLAKANGRRPVGRPRTRWTDYIEDLGWNRLGLRPSEMMEVMEDREVWRLNLELLPPQPSRKSGQWRKKKEEACISILIHEMLSQSSYVTKTPYYVILVYFGPKMLRFRKVTLRNFKIEKLSVTLAALNFWKAFVIKFDSKQVFCLSRKNQQRGQNTPLPCKIGLKLLLLSIYIFNSTLYCVAFQHVVKNIEIYFLTQTTTKSNYINP